MPPAEQGGGVEQHSARLCTKGSSPILQVSGNTAVPGEWQQGPESADAEPVPLARPQCGGMKSSGWANPMRNEFH